jgi:hypothetical protein
VAFGNCFFLGKQMLEKLCVIDVAELAHWSPVPFVIGTRLATTAYVSRRFKSDGLLGTTGSGLQKVSKGWVAPVPRKLKMTKKRRLGRRRVESGYQDHCFRKVTP